MGSSPEIPELDSEFEKFLSVKKSGTDAEFVKGLASATLGGVRREGESLRQLLGAVHNIAKLLDFRRRQLATA